jgi:hypothetical protein
MVNLDELEAELEQHWQLDPLGVDMLKVVRRYRAAMGLAMVVRSFLDPEGTGMTANKWSLKHYLAKYDITCQE